MDISWTNRLGWIWIHVSNLMNILTFLIQPRSAQPHSYPVPPETLSAAGSANHRPPVLGGRSHRQTANPGNQVVIIAHLSFSFVCNRLSNGSIFFTVMKKHQRLRIAFLLLNTRVGLWPQLTDTLLWSGSLYFRGGMAKRGLYVSATIVQHHHVGFVFASKAAYQCHSPRLGYLLAPLVSCRMWRHTLSPGCSHHTPSDPAHQNTL